MSILQAKNPNSTGCHRWPPAQRPHQVRQRNRLHARLQVSATFQPPLQTTGRPHPQRIPQPKLRRRPAAPRIARPRTKRTGHPATSGDRPPPKKNGPANAEPSRRSQRSPTPSCIAHACSTGHISDRYNSAWCNGCNPVSLPCHRLPSQVRQVLRPSWPIKKPFSYLLS